MQPVVQNMQPPVPVRGPPSAAIREAAKSQPWKAFWPPRAIDNTAPYGFRKGETIVNSGN